MRAKDVMTTDVITIDPEVDVTSVAKILLDHRISAVLVSNENGDVLGVVSEGDLMRRSERDPGRSWWLSLAANSTDRFVRRHGTRAKDIMSRDVISVTQDASLADVARILESNHIKRVPVIEGGRLVGLVTRADVLRGLASFGHREVRPTVEDWDIRSGIIALVKRSTGVSMQSADVIVANGEVYLWGIVENERDRTAVRVAAENVVGVTKVHNFMNTLSEVVHGLS
ncbi:CBS domain-containing protein [Methyloceanibacter sp.]|uniref:CBS domain-containing protein n=1 Tax=Methyloceanibacter sp. TaxID=1965321 RepID=UPI002CECD827|nr:CBS domain-containing protein [Methyloceanibacter sp.]HML90844.1 CBS domain-containing protein [Methyloceanibacter sp.]